MADKAIRLSSSQRKMIHMVEEIANFLRNEWFARRRFEGWPGLPAVPGGKPTLEEANHFFLGCCIDWQEKTSRAWSRADTFCKQIVRPRRMKTLWKWIANHKESAWKTKRCFKTYKLHRLRNGHNRMHQIAKIIQVQFGGDPRRIWASRRKHGLLPVLVDEVKVGPALGRMIVGALRDHKLVRIRKSDFKPDIHVQRLMRALGLYREMGQEAALEAAKTCFKDPWMVDACFYNLGADYRVKTKRQFLDYYAKMRNWSGSKNRLRKRIGRLKGVLLSDLGPRDWSLYDDSSLHWVGLDLVKDTGPLASSMNKENTCPLWAWFGVGFEGQLVSAIEIGGEVKYFSRQEVVQALNIYKLKEYESSSSARDYKRFWFSHALSSQRELGRTLREKARIAKEILEVLEAGFSQRTSPKPLRVSV